VIFLALNTEVMTVIPNIKNLGLCPQGVLAIPPTKVNIQDI
jgi:hypothetical protein